MADEDPMRAFLASLTSQMKEDKEAQRQKDEEQRQRDKKTRPSHPRSDGTTPRSQEHAHHHDYGKENPGCHPGTVNYLGR
jgi:hypothetical protein